MDVARIRFDAGSCLANPRLIYRYCQYMNGAFSQWRERATDLFERNGDILVKLGSEDSDALWLWRELRDRHAGQAA